jgi:DNA-binding winged helix-turn-helix (wHTH) protein
VHGRSLVDMTPPSRSEPITTRDHQALKIQRQQTWANSGFHLVAVPSESPADDLGAGADLPVVDVVAFGDLELDSALFELRRGGTRVPIEPQTFDVLAYLVMNRHRVVAKVELMDAVWGGRFVSEAAVTSRIKHVRRAVGDDGDAQRVIQTVHGRGYRFIATVRTGVVAA